MIAKGAVVSAALFVVFASTDLVFAQASMPAPPSAKPNDGATESGGEQYDQLIRKALVEFNLGDWGEAKAFFLRAHTLRPSARTLRSLGLTSYEQRLYVEALSYFRQALDSQVRPLTADMRAQVSTQIEEAKSFVSYALPVLEPADLSLRLDGQPAPREADGSVMMDPGEHVFEARAAGYQAQARSVTAHGAEHIELRIVLSRLPPMAATTSAATSAAIATAPRTSESFWATRTTPQWVGLGLGAGAIAAVGVGTVFSVLAVNQNHESKQSCNDNVCNSADGLEHRDSALAHADVATVSFIVAGALAAGAVVSYFLVPGERQRATAWGWSPSVGRGIAAVSLHGAF